MCGGPVCILGSSTSVLLSAFTNRNCNEMAEAAEAHGEPQAGEVGPGGDQAMEQSYTYEGQPYVATNRRSKVTGFVGAKPSSLAALVTGKTYLSDPLTPLTPRPNVCVLLCLLLPCCLRACSLHHFCFAWEHKAAIKALMVTEHWTDVPQVLLHPAP